MFPDFTLSRVRVWWGDLYKNFVAMGIAGFWNDMNEPAVFNESKTMPLDVVHRLDGGAKVDHRAIHNVFGTLNARATYEGVRRLRPDERPFVLTRRKAFAGAQRWAASWTGDNSPTWNHLALTTPMLLSLGLSHGYRLVGDDIGGFAGSPPPDLLTRWLELGAFNPVFRGHAQKGTRYREPWMDGPEHEAIRRRAIERRYALMPYLYTAAEEMSRTGVPMMRPLFLEYPNAPKLVIADDRPDFLFGADLLVAPAFSEKPQPEDVLLPPGRWYEDHSSTVHESSVTLRPALDDSGLRARRRDRPRAGRRAERRRDAERTARVARLSRHGCRGALYQDDGHHVAYEKGKFLRVRYACDAGKDGVSVESRVEKRPLPPVVARRASHRLRNAAAPREVRVRGKAVNGWNYDAAARARRRRRAARARRLARRGPANSVRPLLKEAAGRLQRTAVRTRDPDREARALARRGRRQVQLRAPDARPFRQRRARERPARRSRGAERVPSSPPRRRA